MSQFSFYEKNLCFDRNLLCFVSLYLPKSCLVLMAYNKTSIPCLFCLISKLFTLGNIMFKSVSRRWILITSGEKFLILNKKTWNICLLLLKVTVQNPITSFWTVTFWTYWSVCLKFFQTITSETILKKKTTVHFFVHMNLVFL